MTITATKIGTVQLGDETVNRFRVVVRANGVRFDGAALPQHGDSLYCWLDDALVAAVYNGACTSDEIAGLVGAL